MLGSSKYSRRKGYAMALFLLVMVVITVAVSGLALASKSSLESSRTALYRNEARLLALSTVETFYAKLTESPSSQDLFIDALRNPSQRGSFFPGWVSSSSSPGASLSPNGSWQNCTLSADNAPKDRVCAKLTVTVAQGTSNVPLLLLLTADVEAGCLGKKERCVKASFQQRLRKPEFYDYLQLNTNSIINPADPTLNGQYLGDSCETQNFNNYTPKCKDLIPAYRSSDKFTGPVYAGDSGLLICPGPTTTTPTRQLPDFTTVEVTSTLATWTSASDYRGDSGCLPKNSVNTALPISSVTALTFPSQTDISKAIANASSSKFTITAKTGQVDLLFDATGIRVNPAQVVEAVTVIPNNSVLEVVNASNTSVSGKAYGSLTVIADGDFQITGDITLDNQNTSAVALVSRNGSIVIDQVATDTDIRTINAVLVSISKSVYVKNWNSKNYVSTASKEPELLITGTIAGKFQGVFGSYDSLSGTLSGGYRKNFNWDLRFRDPLLAGQLFPWLPRPTTIDWRRLDLTEVKTL